MRIRHPVLPVVLLGLAFFVGGCERNYPESTQTLDVTTQPVSGSNIRLLSITSAKFCFIHKQDEVRMKFEAAVNGGEYNIASAKTSYTSGYLTAAEITYDVSVRGDGNNMRVMFIQSNKYFWRDKAADIKSGLDEVVNSGRYDIVKINATYVQGYLFAAEVYYREER